MTPRARRSRTAQAETVVTLMIPLALVLAACGGAGDSSEEVSNSSEEVSSPSEEVSSLRVLDYFAHEPDSTVHDQLYEACGEQIGVTIEREAVPGDTLIARVLQQASAGTLPDVLMLDNPDVQEIASTGALVPLSTFGLSAEGYVQGVVDASTLDGELYGLQPITNSIALFYNTEVLAEAGVTPPTTWAEFRTAAQALTSGDQYGIALSAPATFEGSWTFLPFMWSNGGDETDIATPEVAEALQLWVDLVNDGSASESIVTWGQGDVNDQFIAGNAAMMINGPWQVPTLEANGVNFEVVSIPVPDAGGTSVAPLGGEAWTVPDTGDEARQATAAEFVGCLNTDEIQLTMATERQTVPTKMALHEQFVADNPGMAAFTEMVRDARARTGKLGTEWPAVAAEIYTAVQEALTGGATPEQALENATSG
jgi:multiple sugar transport system substrate-binding protein